MHKTENDLPSLRSVNSCKVRVIITKYDELCATKIFFMQISWWHIKSATNLKKSLKSGT